MAPSFSKLPGFTAAALLLLAALAAPAPAAKIGRITLTQSAAGHLLRVETGGLTAPVLQTAERKLIIVVPGGERALTTLKLGAGPVAEIRFGREGHDLHLVLDLRQKLRGRLLQVGTKGFSVELADEAGGPAKAGPDASPSAPPSEAGSAKAPALQSQAPQGSAAQSVQASSAQATLPAPAAAVDSLNPAQAGYTYRVVDLSLGGDDKHAELVVSADGPASYKSSVRDNGRLLSLVFRNCSLAWSGDSGALKDDAIAGVQVRQVQASGETQVKLDIRLSGALNYAFKRDQNQLVVRLDRPPRTESPAGSGDMETPVSLDVQGADLVGVLKTLCEQAGFEYQFTRDILSKVPPDSLVTLKVENRPFREVLDTLLTQVNSRYLRQGNTVYMGSESDIYARRNRLPVITRAYRPKYLTFKQMVSYIAINYYFDDNQKERVKGMMKDPRDPSQVLLVGSEDEVAAWIGIIKKYDVPESGEEGAGDDSDGGSTPKTQVFRLQYLDSSNSALITGAIRQLYLDPAEVPDVLIDANTRTMVVTTPVKYLRKIEKLLSRIDVKPQQVNIEGKIVEVDQGLSQQMGINWNVATQASQLVDPTTLKAVPEQLGSFNTGLTGAFTSQLQTAIIAGSNNINSTIQAMVDTTKADIVSAPNVTTADNQAATISTTDVQVYTQSTTTISNGVVTLAQTFPTSNIPLTLVVTPKISQTDHRILMNINFQLTTTNGAAPAAGAPLPTSQQSAITNVSVNSGDTAVIGGLVRQNNTEETRKIPVLGDIPLLGLLFKFNTVSKTKKEVIIFITPTIVED